MKNESDIKKLKSCQIIRSGRNCGLSLYTDRSENVSLYLRWAKLRQDLWKPKLLYTLIEGTNGSTLESISIH